MLTYILNWTKLIVKANNKINYFVVWSNTFYLTSHDTEFAEISCHIKTKICKVGIKKLKKFKKSDFIKNSMDSKLGQFLDCLDG